METRSKLRRLNSTEPKKIDEIIVVDDDEDTASENLEKENDVVLYQNPISAVEILNMKTLMGSFTGNHPESFFEHCRTFMNAEVMESVELLTIEQANTPLWFLMRYGRITASRIHQASRCKTKNGSLVDSIMGKKSGGFSFAMARGNDLESKVFNVLKKQMKVQNSVIRQCGLFLDPHLPHFAASPDGIAEDFVVEIKCPATPKTHAEYINVNTLQPKYYAQIQLQMHITKKERALLGVADLQFERNKKVTKVWIDYDKNYVNSLIEDAHEFWIEAIYPQLKRKHK